jgi:hypothetical protein
LSFLADEVVDPEATDLKVRRLYLLCRGTITEVKKQVLNLALLLFGETLYLLSTGENPDPTMMSTEEKAKVSLLSSVSCFLKPFDCLTVFSLSIAERVSTRYAQLDPQDALR